MKVYKVAGMGVVLFAVVALCAMGVASTASAAVTFLLALWLENGAVVAENVLVETSGELELENTKAPIVGNAGELCSEIFDGFVGPESKDEITEVLTLTGTALSLTALVESALLCTNILNCEASKLWAVNLPWTSELELYVDGAEEGFVILLTSAFGAKTVGWTVECTDLGIKAQEECTTATAVAQAENVVGGVQAVFSDAFTTLMEQKLALCSGNNEETAIVTGSGVEKTSLAGPLEVSE